jgi:hypothetical protein
MRTKSTRESKATVPKVVWIWSPGCVVTPGSKARAVFIVGDARRVNMMLDSVHTHARLRVVDRAPVVVAEDSVGNDPLSESRTHRNVVVIVEVSSVVVEVLDELRMSLRAIDSIDVETVLLLEDPDVSNPSLASRLSEAEAPRSKTGVS